MVNVSLVIPAFQRIEQTTRTISLIFESRGLGEDFGLEVIVADSTPDSTLLDSITKTFGDKVVYTRPAKPGIAANKNQGARIAKYPLIVFCDSDIEVDKEALVCTVESFKKTSRAACVTGSIQWKGGPDDGTPDRPRAVDRTVVFEGATYIESIYSRYMATYREVFWSVGGYDEVVFNMRGEGSDMGIRYWRAGYPLLYDASIRVHHIHDAPQSAALRVEHPEWGIAKDLFLLGYKYGLFEGTFANFARTVKADFAKFGELGYFRLLAGLGKNYDFILEVKHELDEQKSQMKAAYDFKFLEVFTDKELYERAIREAEGKLVEIRKSVFS